MHASVCMSMPPLPPPPSLRKSCTQSHISCKFYKCMLNRGTTLHTALRRLFWFWGSSAAGQPIPWKPSWQLAALREYLITWFMSYKLRSAQPSSTYYRNGNALLCRTYSQDFFTLRPCKWVWERLQENWNGWARLPASLGLPRVLNTSILTARGHGKWSFFYLLWWALATRPYNCGSRAKTKCVLARETTSISLLTSWEYRLVLWRSLKHCEFTSNCSMV